MIKIFIYRFIDIITFGTGIKVNISGIHLRLPTRYYKYYEKDYEKGSIEQMQHIVDKGHTVLDIGAQLGLMTKMFSDCVGPTGKVFSFEPTPSTYALLSKTIAINNLNNVTAVKKAVSDKEGTIVFNISDTEASAANSLASSDKSDVTGITVQVTSIDAFVKNQNIAHLDFIKIDAEGAEYAVLKGAESTLKRDRPKLLLALHPEMITNFGDTLSEIYSYCKERKYAVLYNGSEMTESSFIAQTNLFDVFLRPLEHNQKKIL